MRPAFRQGIAKNYENDCLDSVNGNYKTKQTYSYDDLYQLIKVDGETTYNPYQSAVPEFKSDYSQVFTFDPDGLGQHDIESQHGNRLSAKINRRQFELQF